MQYVFVPLILVVLAVLAWSWWSARSDRDPASSVDSFNRALTAMQPGSRPGRPAPADRSATDADEASTTDDVRSDA